jgi:hypothetical protein
MKHKIYNMMIIAIQHFCNTALTKAFWISTVIGPLFIVAISVLPSLIASDPFTLDDDNLILLVRPDDSALPSQLQDALDDRGGYIRLEIIDSREAGRERVLGEEADGLLAGQR